MVPSATRLATVRVSKNPASYNRVTRICPGRAVALLPHTLGRGFRADDGRRAPICHDAVSLGSLAPTDSTDDTLEPQDQQQAFRWDRYWWPVQLVYNLGGGKKPMRVQVLGEAYVVWKSGGQWRCAADLCPHRLAPLSEGRVEDDGSLMCAYHGWRFDDSGTCTTVPQADDEKVLKMACSSPRSCLHMVPVKEDCGMLWVWPDGSPEGRALAAQCSPVVPPDFRQYMATVADTQPDNVLGYTRLLPYSHDVLVENLADPSHLPVSHHKIAPALNRNKATKLVMTPASSLHHQTEGAAQAGENAPPGASMLGAFDFNSVFRAGHYGHIEMCGPGLVEYRYAKTKTDPDWTSTVLFATPVVPGKSRAFVFAWSAKAWRQLKGEKMKKAGGFFVMQGVMTLLLPLLPKWVGHQFSHRIFDSDGVFLHLQDKNLRNRGGRWAQEYYMPTSADRMLLRFRRWVDREGRGGPQYVGGQELPPGDITRQQLLDRYTSHTQECTVCQEGLTTLQRIERVATAVLAGAAGALCVMLGAAGGLGGILMMKGRLLACLVLAAGAWWARNMTKTTRQEFHFRDWVHANVD